MQALILAAGRGLRMGALTANCPKPLLSIGSDTLIGHNLRKLQAAGVREVIINTFYLGQMLPIALGDGAQFGLSIRYSHECEPLETAGGIKNALPLIEAAAFLVVNADVYCDYDFAALQPALQCCEREQGAHLLMVDNPAHHPQGDFLLHAHKLFNPPCELGTALTYSGIGVYHRQEFAQLPNGKQPLVTVLRRLANSGKLRGEHYRGRWLDVGNPARLFALRQQLATS